MSLATEYIVALSLTIAVELIVAAIFGYRSKAALLAVVLVNIITNPIANYIVLFNRLINLLPEHVLIAVVEICIVFVEWGLLVYVLKGNRTKLFLLSLVIRMVIAVRGLALCVIQESSN